MNVHHSSTERQVCPDCGSPDITNLAAEGTRRVNEPYFLCHGCGVRFDQPDYEGAAFCLNCGMNWFADEHRGTCLECGSELDLPP